MRLGGIFGKMSFCVNSLMIFLKLILNKKIKIRYFETKSERSKNDFISHLPELDTVV